MCLWGFALTGIGLQAESPVTRLVCVLLVPLIPAALLFKLLPNSASVDGVFQKLNIKLSGAFAAYFLLLLTAIEVYPAYAPPSDLGELWTVTGHIEFPPGLEDPQNQVLYELVPRESLTANDGSFRIILPRKDENGVKEFPYLVCHISGFKDETIDLNQTNALALDGIKHRAQIKPSITFKRKPHFSEGQTSTNTALEVMK
jgi:hypothetical protein